jgi:translation initiation factor 4B
VSFLVTSVSFHGSNTSTAKERQESNRDFSDWSRKGPLPDMPGQGRQPSRTFERRPFEDRSDAGSEAGGSKRPGYFQDDGKVRDFGDWSRKGPLSPSATAAVPAREGRGNPSWGEGRGSDAGSRPPRKEFQERAPVERAPTAADQDSQWREKMRADPAPVASPEASTPSSPQVAQAPKERPRLNLTKRTVSEQKPDDAPAAAPQSKASPFGAARPTDTANRDREIAEKREIAIREKKEADDKVKEEKAAKETAARQARSERADKGQTDQDDKSPEAGSRRASRQQNGPPKNNPWRQNGEQSDKNVSILKRDNEAVEQEAQRDMPDGDANGDIVADKETKPQEVTREVVRDAGEGAKQTEGTAETLEDEGWSTVSAKPKNSRRGGARAMAS